MSAHTKGPWVVDSGEALSVRAPHGGIVAQLHHLRGRHGMGGRLPDGEAVANARLIAAAPELAALAANFEITGPDGDGLVWLVLHGNGLTGRAMFNLGQHDTFVAKVALMLEQDRRDAIRKATEG